MVVVFFFFFIQASVLCARFCVDSPYSLVVGGKKNGFHIINVANLPQGTTLVLFCFCRLHDSYPIIQLCKDSRTES